LPPIEGPQEHSALDLDADRFDPGRLSRQQILELI
jgi:hypothetical protein